MICFPYKSTPFYMGAGPLPKLSYPVIFLFDEDIYFFHSYHGEPDSRISEQEYLEIIKQLEYKEEFSDLVND